MALTVGSLYSVNAAVGSPQKQTLASKLVAAQITFDSSYPTGGEALVASDFGLTEILAVICLPSGGYVGEFDEANGKLKTFWVDTTVDGAPLAEVADTTDLSAVVMWCIAIGI